MDQAAGVALEFDTMRLSVSGVAVAQSQSDLLAEESDGEHLQGSLLFC